MKFSSIKAVLSLGIVSAIIALTVAYGGARPVVVEPVEAASRPDKSVAIAPAVITENEAPPMVYEAGTLLAGSDHVVHYITEAGTRQPIYDDETFLAFGFQPAEVIEVDDDVLASIPAADVLSRLVFDEQNNLYWVMDGQLWQLNAWQQVVNDPHYNIPTGRLAPSLREAWPIQLGLKNAMFLRQDDTVYYFMHQSVAPLEAGSYDEFEVVDVPPGVLAVYKQQAGLETVFTTLNDDTPAANARRGPGLEFEVIDTVYDNNTIVAKGRTENNWLQIKHRGQVAWLAGDLVKRQSLLNLLPMVDTGSLIPPAASPQQTNNISPKSNKYSGIGVLVNFRNGWPVVTNLMDGLPAYRAGIEAGDIIRAVDGQNVAALSLGQVSERIRGQQGTPVSLTIFRPRTNESLEISIIRAQIDPSTVTWACQAKPIRGFGKVWRERPEIHQWLGCPFTNFRRDEHATRAAVQTFEHGWLLWLETDTVANVDPIYVFYEADGTYIRFGDRPLTDAHQYAPTQSGFYKVGDRFAKVYWEEIGPQGRQQLGRATNEARDSLGAFQEFEHGRMFWAGQSDTIYVIYQGQLDLDGDGQSSWTQAWTSYEDTFEAPSE